LQQGLLHWLRLLWNRHFPIRSPDYGHNVIQMSAGLALAPFLFKFTFTGAKAIVSNIFVSRPAKNTGLRSPLDKLKNDDFRFFFLHRVCFGQFPVEQDDGRSYLTIVGAFMPRLGSLRMPDSLGNIDGIPPLSTNSTSTFCCCNNHCQSFSP